MAQELTVAQNASAIGEAIAKAAAEAWPLALPKGVNPDRFRRVVLDQLNQNPDLRRCTPASVVGACAKAAADGLMLDGKEAALVIYSKRENGEVVAREAQYIPMVAGIRRRIYNSGMVSVLTTGIVYENEIETGRFEYIEGTEPKLIHRPMLSGELGSRVAVYSVVTMNNGYKSVEVMRWTEVMRIARLQTKNIAKYDDARKGIKKGGLAGIWGEHTDEMARKTVLRRHAKQLPFDSEHRAMFERVDDLYGGTDEIDHDIDEGAPPAAPRKTAGGAAAKLREATQPAQETAPADIQEADYADASDPDDQGGDHDDDHNDVV